MPRRRPLPPELRRRSWTEGTVWELLVALDALPYRFVSPFADLGLTARERRRLRQEREQLKATAIACILPRPGTARRSSDLWVYVHVPRFGHYRVDDAGAIERYGRRVQRLSGTTISEHRWYPCSLRGVRWLAVVAEGRVLRAARDHPGAAAAITAGPPAALRPITASPAAEQLPLFLPTACPSCP